MIRAAEAGVSDFIAKPWDLAELYLRSESLLRTKTAMDGLKEERARLEVENARRTHDLRGPRPLRGKAPRSRRGGAGPSGCGAGRPDEERLMSTAMQARTSRAPAVIILDDDPQLRNAAVRILGQRGYRTLAADSAARALEIATDWPGPLDLLICDLVLPGLGGREAANALQARHPEMKILFISGYSSPGSFRREVQDAGGVFLGKPFGVPELLEAVEMALAGRSSRPGEARLGAGS